MKVLAKVLFMALMFGTTYPTLAEENNALEPLVTIRELAQGKVQLTYKGKTPEKLHVHIYNDEDRTIFKETIRSKSAITKPYNISELPYGEYRFEVRVAEELVVHKIHHRAPKAPGNVKLIVAPVESGKFRMTVAGPEFKDFKVRIYDDHNRLIFQESIQQSGNVGKIFDLKATRAKTVKLVLNHKNTVVQRRTIDL